MKYLFTKDSLNELAELSGSRLLIALDFDGTLAEIKRERSEARVGRGTTRLLKILATVVPIAIISGRSRQDLKRRLDFSPQYLIGNHGIEGLATFKGTGENAKEICLSWKKQMVSLVPKDKFLPGVEVEDKTFSLTFHYRHSGDKRKTKLAIMRMVGDLTPGPRFIFGKQVVNLLPPLGFHKGSALLAVMREAGAHSALFIGDDNTDEDVFALQKSRIFTIRVGQKRSSCAQYFIKRQSEINRLLRQLLKQFVLA